MSRRRFLAVSATAVGTAGVSLEKGSAEGPPLTGVFRAGAASSNITPPLGAGIHGPISASIDPAVHVRDDLFARCLALDDGRTRVAIGICDMGSITRDLYDRAKDLVHEATGLRRDRILLAATHTHAAPRAIGMGETELDHWFLDFLARRIADGVRRALNNLAPAEVGWGSARKPEHVFNRRWFLREGAIPPDPFGGTTDRVRMNPPRGGEDLLEPAGPVDPEVAFLSVRHADGRPLALLGNYGLHYVGGYEQGHVSADYFGLFADRVQELLDADRLQPPFVGMLSNGASGDVNNIDFRRSAQRQEPWRRMAEVADDVARDVVRAQSVVRHLRDVTLDMRESELDLGVRRPDAERLAWARKLWSKARENPRWSRPEIYARETLVLADCPSTVPIKLQALRIGPVGIAAVPCEVFAETGLAVKAESPLRPTFTIELANGYNGYLPPPRHHDLGGYETWPARSAYLEVDSEPRILAEVLRLLREVGSP